jgi:hypothetical protein
MPALRTVLLALSVLVATTASHAQAPASPKPPPAPLPPPPPATVTPPPLPNDAADADLGPQVTIIRRDADVVEEVRINGQLRFIKVTPKVGLPYYLVPDSSGSAFIRRDSLDISLKVPLWVLFSF